MSDSVPLTSDDLALMEKIAAPLYESAVTGGGIRVDDPRLSPGSLERDAFDLLIRLGLLSDEPVKGRHLPVDPTGSQAQVIAPLGVQGAELIAEASRWAQAYAPLAHSWRRSPVAHQAPYAELRGSRQITSFVRAAVDDATEELLTAQPQAGRSIRLLANAEQRDSEALERGVAMRTLYQHAARRNAATRRYVQSVTAKGAQVRTLDEFFNRMIVVDRTLAVIPSPEGVSVAVAVREPAVVAYLVDVFERAWERARPFTYRQRGDLDDIASEQRQMTIRMLVQGHSDPVASKRLGVSLRTYASYVADLKEEYDAETRFQLGYLMGQGKTPGNPPDAETGSPAE